LAVDVAVVGSHAYLAPFIRGLQAVDISDPAFPVLAGSVETPGRAAGLAVWGSYAYVADGFKGLQVVDASNPALPQVEGGVDTQDYAQGVAVSGSYAYVADWFRGHQVVPAQCEGPIPVLLSGFTAEARDRSVLLSWFTSFESLHDGFNVYRSRRLESGYAKLNDPLVRGRSPYSYLDRKVRASTTYYYKLGAVDSRGGEVIHPPTSVTTSAWGLRTALSSSRPSPFREETLLEFTLAGPSEVKLAVYDVAGRLVRVLVRQELPEGDHTAVWDGRDDRGTRAGPGTYIIRLKTEGAAETRKVVFLGGN
jgi:hypothetical protein